ncbi:MAG: hypothetical protein MJA27_18060 [Pseudanabaenales cyanobacterium]|nr:hypothetical protein [Pseudanabaenales cyanobacterium]
MTQKVGQDSKAKVLAAFEQILTAQRQMQSRVATKEEEAEKERNLQVLETVAQLTPDGIVRGFADLQLSFSAVMSQMSGQLTTETDKRDDLQRAIAVETQRLQDLQQTRVVADALYILNQEHQENLRLLQARIAREQEALEKEKIATQKVWRREQAEFEQSASIREQLLVQERQCQEENYQYETGRSRTISNDDYEEARRQAERQIQETNQAKEKQWAERENVLAANQTKLEEYRQKADAFPQELEEATQKAREESIKETHDAAKVRANLLEKEWEATQQGYELQIQSLEAKIQKQTEAITSISTQLQTAMGQAQDLAMQAFSSSSRQLSDQPKTTE